MAATALSFLRLFLVAINKPFFLHPGLVDFRSKSTKV